MSESEKLIEEIERMDWLSKNIVLTLHIYGKLRFNELDKALRGFGLEYSRPTLVDRLDSLVRKRWLTRKKEGKQCVIYGLKEGKGKAFDLDPEEAKRIEEVLLSLGEKYELEEIEPEPKDEVKLLVWLFLNELLAEIIDRIRDHRPSNIFSDYFRFNKSMFRKMAEQMIERSTKDIGYQMKILEAISEMIKQRGKSDDGQDA